MDGDGNVIKASVPKQPKGFGQSRPFFVGGKGVPLFPVLLNEVVTLPQEQILVDKGPFDNGVNAFPLCGAFNSAAELLKGIGVGDVPHWADWVLELVKRQLREVVVEVVVVVESVVEVELNFVCEVVGVHREEAVLVNRKPRHSRLRLLLVQHSLLVLHYQMRGNGEGVC